VVSAINISKEKNREKQKIRFGTMSTEKNRNRNAKKENIPSYYQARFVSNI
jgi:hypothetical protein